MSLYTPSLNDTACRIDHYSSPWYTPPWLIPTWLIVIVHLIHPSWLLLTALHIKVVLIYTPSLTDTSCKIDHYSSPDTPSLTDTYTTALIIMVLQTHPFLTDTYSIDHHSSSDTPPPWVIPTALTILILPIHPSWVILTALTIIVLLMLISVCKPVTPALLTTMSSLPNLLSVSLNTSTKKFLFKYVFLSKPMILQIYILWL